MPFSLWLGADGVQRALLAGSVLAALLVELLDSAPEAAGDRGLLDDHPLAKRAKDLGSAAVMLSIANAALVWLLVFFG